MAKDRKKLQHIHSSIPDKQPTAASLEVGEIAVNNAQNQEFLSIKNSNDKVVRFSSDEQTVTIMEKKEVIPYSGTVDNVHLDTNRSNIEIKLNQVVAGNTVKHDVVNGATDIDGDLVNPTTDGGLTNGAGFAIDMSIYAMQGANPSFSSVTTTCGARLSGTTEIVGGSEECGSKLDITTNETSIKSCDEIRLESKNLVFSNGDCGEGEMTIETSDLCLVGENKINVYGKETNVGIDCDEEGTAAEITNVKGDTINVYAETANTEVSEAVTNINTATTTISSAKTDILTATTTVNTLNTTATTATLDGNNLTINESGDVIVNASDDICVTSQDEAAFYGKNNTKVGVACDGSVTTNATVQSSGITNIYGPTTNISGGTENNTFSTINTTSAIINQSGGTYNITGNTNINGDTNITGETTINGDTHINGKFYFTNTCSSITSNELSDALCEMMGRTDISVTGSSRNDNNNSDTFQTYTVKQNGADKEEKVEIANVKTSSAQTSSPQTDGTYRTFNVTYSGTSRGGIAIPNVTITSTTSGLSDGILKQYDIMYDGVSRGKIDIPKDFLVKSGSTKQVTQPDVPYSGAAVGDWYIELVLNVKSGSSEENKVYIPANGLVKDMDVVDTPAIDLDIWYDTVSGQQKISADTTIKINSQNGLKEFSKNNAVHTLDAYKLTTEAGKYTESSDTSFDPFKANATIKIPTDVSHITRENLTANHSGKNFVYDPAVGSAWTMTHSALTATYEATSGKSGAVTYDTNGNKSISIPTNVNHLNRGKFTVKHCAQEVTFDPATDASMVMSHGNLTAKYEATSGKSGTVVFNVCDNNEISIPTSVCHLERGKLTIEHGTESVTYDPCSSAWTAFEHGILKFTQNGSDLGTYDPEDLSGKTIEIPAGVSCVNQLNRHKITFKAGQTSGFTSDQTYDPGKDCANSAETINIPTCVNHLNRHTVKFQSGSTSSFNNQTYDPGKDCANTAETINIPTCVSHLNRHNIKFQSGDTKNFNNQTFDAGKDCANTAETINIPTSVEHLNRGTLTFTQNGGNLGTYDPGVVSGKTIDIPKGVSCVSELGRATFEWQYGAPCNASGGTYDPGANCSGNSVGTIVVPKTIGDLTNNSISVDCSGGCISISNDVCVDGVLKANALYSTSDANLKENAAKVLYEDYHKVSKVDLKSFNFKDDETKRKTYGVIAQEVQEAGLNELIHTDDKGNLAVDYTSFLILKIADMQEQINELNRQIKALKEKNQENNE